MQTSIEWLIEKLIDYKYLKKDAGHYFEQAKEMHKHEHRRTFIHGVCENGKSSKEKFEQYYQDTFKKD